MFGLFVMVQTQTPTPAAPAAPPAQPTPPPPVPRAVAAARCRRRRNAGADFSPKPPVNAAHAAGTGEDLHRCPPAIAWSSSLAEPEVISPAVDSVRRQRPHVRRRVHDLHARRRRQQPARAGEPHHALREHQGRRRLRQAHGLRRQARAAAHDRAARRQQHPHQRDARPTTSSSTPTPTTTASPTSASMFYSGIGLGRDGNLEHEQAGFIWGLDNWIYRPTTRSASAGRRTASSRSRPARTAAQWGVTMDDDGKMWFIDAGGERGPMNFQVPIHYGAFSVPEQVRAGIRDRVARVGARRHAGRHGSRASCRSARLNHFTATSGADIVRGAPRARTICSGDLLFTEPVGRLIRRARIVQERRADAAAQRRIPDRSSCSSTDPLFRPVNIKHGAGRRDLHRRHVSRHHPGIELDAPGIVPAREDRAVPARQGHRLRPHLAAALRRLPACRRRRPVRRHRRRRDSGAARVALDPTQPRMLDETPAQLVRPSRPRERLVARHGAAAARPEAGQVGRARAADARRGHRAASWPVSTRCGRSKAWARSTCALVREQMKDSEPAHARAGDSRQRDALQGRRPRPRRRLSRDDQGRRSRTSSSRRC